MWLLHAHTLGIPSSLLSPRVLLLLACLQAATACDKGVCHDYGNVPSLDKSSRPPNARVLGRETWTVLHTTAAYLPDRLSSSDADNFRNLVFSVTVLYPGEGRDLIAAIVQDATMKEEIEAMATAEDAQLVVWKLHNCVTAHLWRQKTLFPPLLDLQAAYFDLVPSRGLKQFRLKHLSGELRQTILRAIKTRWVIAGGLEVTRKHWNKQEVENLPPDRKMLGHAYWTYMHTVSVYLPERPTPHQLAAFRAIFDAIYHIFPCPVCRGHFHLFYHDPILQRELAAVDTKHGAIMFVWKLHNIVTTDGIRRGDWPHRKIFPQEKHLKFNLSQFSVPSPHSAQDQLRITSPCKGKHSSATCLSSRDGYEVIADVQARWQIEGGIDQPLEDSAPASCPPPTPSLKILRLDMYVMGKCPWCAKSMEKLADNITCDFQCSYRGKALEARMDFRIHMVGLNNGTYRHPWLKAIHGPSELVGERLELCARQHYPKNYQYLRFFKCMDKDVKKIPMMAPECAEEAEMDLNVLVGCANMEGERLVASSYAFSSYMGIGMTPTFVINGGKPIVGLPSNFSEELCFQLATTSVTLQQAREKDIESLYPPQDRTDEIVQETSVWTFVAFFAVFICIAPLACIIARLRRRRALAEERRALLRS
uniref:Sulfhydryl oxidase n=1 Tax=Guillardia theta TaxID=55529 RepID=A0A7S4PP56_GUITH|mmetsp:Transcript_6846/g.24044  ORF Transcript_6846/g.24044 Transcript_6846/m.24044 type:complete len:648 (+) Transcript_6846:104-2047(+)